MPRTSLQRDVWICCAGPLQVVAALVHPDRDPANALRAAREQAAALALDGHVAGQGALELDGERLDERDEVGRVGAQARRDEVEAGILHRRGTLLRPGGRDQEIGAGVTHGSVAPASSGRPKFASNAAVRL